MDRRNFVRLGAVAGTLALRGKPLAGESMPTEDRRTEQAGGTGFPVAPFRLEEATLGQLQAEMAAGRMTARSITREYIARIHALDRAGPTLRHVLEVNPDALSIAADL